MHHYFHDYSYNGEREKKEKKEEEEGEEEEGVLIVEKVGFQMQDVNRVFDGNL